VKRPHTLVDLPGRPYPQAVVRVARPRRLIALAAALGSLGLAGCGHSGRQATGPIAVQAQHGRAPVTWTGRVHIRGVVDLTAPGPDGSLVVAARGRLFRLSPAGIVRPFAAAYAAPPGLEPYIVRSPGLRLPGSRCTFAAGDIYALRLAHGNGITRVTPAGTVRRFAALPHRGLENGIAFDQTGRFGHRLLVTTGVAGHTVLTAIDCRGRPRVLAGSAPRVEGGLAVAPATFGRFSGDLIAPDELSGNIYALTPAGRVAGVVASGLPHGQDIGVESAGFVPASFRDALVADRRTTGNRHPGDDLVLGVARSALAAAGVGAGDLLVVTEGGAATVDVRCRATCRVRPVGHGPSIAHIEGHVVFTGAG
jgi:hypothetical protein